MKLTYPKICVFGRCKKYIHIYTHQSCLSPKRQERHLRYSSGKSMFYQNDVAMRDIVDVTGGKPIAVRLQFISGVSAINPLAFYDIHGRKKISCGVLDRTKDRPLFFLFCLFCPLSFSLVTS
jgi:hypothetical protein